MELHDLYFATGNGMKARRGEKESDARNFLSYEDELKSSWAMAGSEIGDEGRGAFLRGMKRALYNGQMESGFARKFLLDVVARYGTVVISGI